MGLSLSAASSCPAPGLLNPAGVSNADATGHRVSTDASSPTNGAGGALKGETLRIRKCHSGSLLKIVFKNQHTKPA